MCPLLLVRNYKNRNKNTNPCKFTCAKNIRTFKSYFLRSYSAKRMQPGNMQKLQEIWLGFLNNFEIRSKKVYAAKLI